MYRCSAIMSGFFFNRLDARRIPWQFPLAPSTDIFGLDNFRQPAEEKIL